jgi:hypothetical protein
VICLGSKIKNKENLILLNRANFYSDNKLGDKREMISCINGEKEIIFFGSELK